MKLKQLEIRLLPGIDQAFTVDFEPSAVNVVTGPNASGKSSLIRAVRALLYPEQNRDFCQLRAEWEREGQRLVCERRGHHVSWFENDAPAEAPTLPGAESLGAFLISSEDLAALGATDAHISGQLRTLLAGGYDLEAVTAEAPLAARPRPQKLARELERLANALAAKESEYADLHDELATLERLNRELEATTDAAVALRACEDALALADAIARRSAMEQTLIEEFPGGMDRLRGDEITRLEQLDQKIAERERELAVENGGLRQAREKLEKTGTVDPHALEALQSELAEQRDRLAAAERDIESLNEAIEQHEQASQAAARRLGGEQLAISDGLDQQALEELEKQVERVQGLREQIRNLTAELARTHVSSNMTGRAQGDLREARQALLRWLEFARLSPLEGVLWGGTSLAAILASWRLLSADAQAVSPELILLVLLATGIPLGLLGQFLLRWRDLGQAREDFLASDIEAPLGWTEEEVEARLERLELELESATRHEVSQVRAAEVREQLNARRTSLERARDQLRAYAAELGIGSNERLETGFLLWARHLHDWQRQQQALDEARLKLEQRQARYQQLQAESAELLHRHGMGSDKSAHSRDLAALIHLLTPRMRQNAELHNQLNSHQRRIEELQADIAQLQRSRDQIHDGAGLKPDQRSTLIQRVEQFDSWRELEQQRRDCSMEITRLEQRLSNEQALLEQARQQQREGLESQQETLSVRVARRDELNRHIAEIHTRHGEVLKRRELEGLQAEYEHHRQTLDDELEQHLMAAAAGALLDDVDQAHQADNEPQALALAGQWFDRFTRHRYQLKFEGEQFAAIDSRDRGRRGLSELSTGTRVQLLLAVRLAWIERAEARAEPLPVFMDEVLTTTDPARYRAVVESVQELAAAGRQMFYLTAQSDDAHAWSTWATEGPTPHLIEMAEVRADQIEPLEFIMPSADETPRRLPDPEGMEPLDWADAAGVDAINPWRDAGSIHVFHLLHDQLELCVKLIELDLARAGDLEAFLRSARAGQLLDGKTRDLLTQRLAAVRLILEDWQQRRFRPVDQAALHASGQVSDHFMPRVLDLNERLDGHPRQLIDSLRDGGVSRFRSDNIDQLEDWLRGHGYLNEESERDRLSAAEISLLANLPPDQITDLRAWINGAIGDPLN
jgi:DNA repair protein SbcC/Rad50